MSWSDRPHSLRIYRKTFTLHNNYVYFVHKNNFNYIIDKRLNQPIVIDFKKLKLLNNF